jgi:hypothetical protein
MVAVLPEQRLGLGYTHEPQRGSMRRRRLSWAMRAVASFFVVLSSKSPPGQKSPDAISSAPVETALPTTSA